MKKSNKILSMLLSVMFLFCLTFVSATNGNGVLSFIPPLWAGILLIVGVLGLVFRMPLATQIAKVFPVFPAQIVLVIFSIIGIMAGGFGWIQGIARGLTSGNGLASFTGQDIAPLEQEVIIESCVYKTGVGLTGNVTLRSDTSSTNNIYVDIDASDWLLEANAKAPAEVNVSFTCRRAGSTQEDGASQIVVKANSYISETDTSSANSYNIIQTTSTPSDIWSGRYVQTLYVEDDAQAGSSSTKEETYLTFSEGDKELDLYVMAEMDQTSFENLNNYSTKKLFIYQRFDDGSDNQLGTITIQKNP